MDFGHSTAPPLAEDPAGGHVEPSLAPALDATASRLGVYGAHGAAEQASLVQMSEAENLRRLLGRVSTDLVSVVAAVNNLDKKRLYIGPFVWTVADSLIRGVIPIDRLPVNATLYRAIALLSDVSIVANEVVTITDLLSVPIRLNPTRDISTQQSVFPVLDLPFKTEGFSIVKSGGGNFTSVGALWLDVREVNLV